MLTTVTAPPTGRFVAENSIRHSPPERVLPDGFSNFFRPEEARAIVASGAFDTFATRRADAWRKMLLAEIRNRHGSMVVRLLGVTTGDGDMRPQSSRPYQEQFICIDHRDITLSPAQRTALGAAALRYENILLPPLDALNPGERQRPIGPLDGAFHDPSPSVIEMLYSHGYSLAQPELMLPPELLVVPELVSV